MTKVKIQANPPPPQTYDSRDAIPLLETEIFFNNGHSGAIESKLLQIKYPVKILVVTEPDIHGKPAVYRLVSLQEAQLAELMSRNLDLQIFFMDHLAQELRHTFAPGGLNSVQQHLQEVMAQNPQEAQAAGHHVLEVYIYRKKKTLLQLLLVQRVFEQIQPEMTSEASKIEDLNLKLRYQDKLKAFLKALDIADRSTKIDLEALGGSVGLSQE